MISNYIYDLLLDNDYVAIPGLGGFVCQYQSANVDRQRSLISPPSRTIAFNKALQQNDGLLVQHIVLNETVSYKDAEDKVRAFVAQCNQQLHQIGSVQFPKIGRLYMDELKHINFAPSYETLPLDDSFGLQVVVLKPIARIKSEPVLAEEESLAQVVEISRPQRAWPYWIAASFAGLFIMGTAWLNVEQTSYKNVLTAGFFTGHEIHTNAPQKTIYTDNSSIQSNYLYELALLKKNAAPVEEVVEDAAVAVDQEYAIVVGAFKGPITAEKYKEHLIAKGYKVETLKTSPNTFIKVVIYVTAANEEEALASVRTSEEKDAWLLN